jgi:hypothetical protein
MAPLDRLFHLSGPPILPKMGIPKMRAIERRMVMTTTAIGLFNDFSEAQRVIPALMAQGVHRKAISIVANCAEASVMEAIATGAWGVNVEVGAASRGEPATSIELGVPKDETQ